MAFVHVGYLVVLTAGGVLWAIRRLDRRLVV
jgi:hypothetical protein